jgi:hypothetical protein
MLGNLGGHARSFGFSPLIVVVGIQPRVCQLLVMDGITIEILFEPLFLVRSKRVNTAA